MNRTDKPSIRARLVLASIKRRPRGGHMPRQHISAPELFALSVYPFQILEAVRRGLVPIDAQTGCEYASDAELAEHFVSSRFHGRMGASYEMCTGPFQSSPIRHIEEPAVPPRPETVLFLRDDAAKFFDVLATDEPDETPEPAHESLTEFRDFSPQDVRKRAADSGLSATQRKALKALAMRLEGNTLRDVADKFDVTTRTVQNWTDISRKILKG